VITEQDIAEFKVFIEECKEDREDEARYPFLLRQFMKSYGVHRRRQDVIDAALDVQQFEEVCKRVLG
jgi:hypothetical protein